jgi:hypothetical protein
MSSINNFMDKKIKKYSWIHELNAAAMKAKLLNEAEQYAKHQQFLAEQNTVEGIAGIRDLLDKIGIDYKQSGKMRRASSEFRKFEPLGIEIPGFRGKGDVRNYNLGPEDGGTPVPAAWRVSDLNPKNSDINNDGEGTAKEVEQDAKNGILGDSGFSYNPNWAMQDSDFIFDGHTDSEQIGMGGLPSYPNVGMTPSTPAPVPPARFPSNMSANEITRLGTEDAINRGLIPQRKSRTLQDLQNQMAVDAALRARGQAEKEGKLPASAKNAGRKAGEQAVRDFKVNKGVEDAAREIIANNPPTGSRPTEDDLRRIAGMFGRGV